MRRDRATVPAREVRAIPKDFARSESNPRGRAVGANAKKKNNLSHRNRRKTAKLRAKLKARHKRVRLRRSSGERATYR